MINAIFKYAVECIYETGYSCILDVFDTKEEAKDLVERRIKADKLLKAYNICDCNYVYCIVLKEVKVNDSI